MIPQINRLTNEDVRRAGPGAVLPDGSGLCLVVGEDGRRRWECRGLVCSGIRQDDVIDATGGLSLAQAREAARAYRKRECSALENLLEQLREHKSSPDWLAGFMDEWTKQSRASQHG